ncbi:MAG: potassium uptake protein TrkH [Marine Group I thaumarchaeote]|jgi:trk system potassium uptake protein TrkH|nr:MAG: potassium uptake protein TrkH [Marine Group I thaumarchaeote]
MSVDPSKSVSYVLSKPVKNYMDSDVVMLGKFTRTRDAARILRHYERDDIIVTDENKKAIGIVTDRDILGKVSDATVYAETTILKDIMSSPLITIEENATLQEALHKMRDNDIRKLPVISKKDQVVGIIFQDKIANLIRDAALIQPRLLSPPVKAILGNLGFVLQFAGALLLVPAIMATVLNDTVTATGIYLSTVLLLVTGFFLNSYGEKASLNLRDASILVFASLFILILYGTIPYLYVSPYPSGSEVELFANSFFSSAAGFTTGGISLFDKPEELPQSFTFYRSFTQLVGGMSFIYLVMTAFYPESKLQSMRGFISGKTLHMRELFGTITIIFSVYIIIVAVLLYLFGERNIIDNFSLAMSTLSTGGFLPTSTILQNLVWQEHLILMAAMILGALPFTFHYAFVRKKFLSPKLGKEVLVYFGVLGVATVIFALISGLDPLFSAFYSVSASTTAGLQLEPLDTLDSNAQAILIALMFIGGCGFSTAGGIKIYRFMQLKTFKLVFSKLTRKNLTRENKKELATTLIILFLFPTISVFTAFHLMDTTGADFADAFLDASGVLTTGGLSADVINLETDPTTKIALSFLMIIGRLEIIAIVYIFVPRLI